MTLYLVATPIGNLSDITFRAVETLRTCDYILCEDTNHSRVLLQHYDIRQPLKSYHKFNEASREQELLSDLKAGRSIALISDAGTPGIADPGERLVQAAVEANILVISIPGACAAVTALTCSGLPTKQFQFVGFLPKKAWELETKLIEILHYPGTTLCYESPRRLIDVLTLLDRIATTRPLCVARELTKRFEEVLRGTAQSLLTHWKEKEIKGEIVLLIAPPSDKELHEDWASLTLTEHVARLEADFGLSQQEAIKMVAHLRGLPKREVYKEAKGI